MWTTTFALMFVLFTGAGGAETLPAARVLQVGSTQSMEAPPFSFYGPAQSDKEGNLFFHISAGSYRKPVVLELNRASGDPTLFSLGDEELQTAVFQEFSVAPSGRVSILCQKTDGKFYALRFSSNGSLLEKIHLDMPEKLSIESFVAFDSGTFFVSAFYLSDTPAELRGKGFMALFDESGTVRRRFSSEPGSVDLKTISQRINDGGAAIGPDGNVYLLQTNQVLVISEAGKIIRRIKYQKPAALSATKIAVSQNLLSIWLLKEGEKKSVSAEYLVIDLLTGKLFGYYVPGLDLGNAAVAVSFTSHEGFTFFDTQSGHVDLLSAPLR
jgi:hypothetical protein